jgi:hypothetical protein
MPPRASCGDSVIAVEARSRTLVHQAGDVKCRGADGLAESLLLKAEAMAEAAELLERLETWGPRLLGFSELFEVVQDRG